MSIENVAARPADGVSDDLCEQAERQSIEDQLPTSFANLRPSVEAQISSRVPAERMPVARLVIGMEVFAQLVQFIQSIAARRCVPAEYFLRGSEELVALENALTAFVAVSSGANTSKAVAVKVNDWIYQGASLADLSIPGPALEKYVYDALGVSGDRCQPENRTVNVRSLELREWLITKEKLAKELFLIEGMQAPSPVTPDIDRPIAAVERPPVREAITVEATAKNELTVVTQLKSEVALAQFRDSIGVSETTFRNFARKAGIVTGRGKKNRRFTRDEQFKILTTFIAECPTLPTKDRCGELLKSL